MRAEVEAASQSRSEPSPVDRQPLATTRFVKRTVLAAQR
jgi:hypothetical protein